VGGFKKTRRRCTAHLSAGGGKKSTLCVLYSRGEPLGENRDRSQSRKDALSFDTREGGGGKIYYRPTLCSDAALNSILLGGKNLNGSSGSVFFERVRTFAVVPKSPRGPRELGMGSPKAKRTRVSGNPKVSVRSSRNMNDGTH